MPEIYNDIQNVMHILVDCDSYNTLRHDTFKKIKANDNVGLDTGNKLQKL